MAYHGLIPLFKQTLFNVDAPKLLEVGVDRGVTFLTLVTFLARTKDEFYALGIDIKVQEQVAIMLGNLDRSERQVAQLTQMNSLDALPVLAQRGDKFDVVLIDGDHNYYTVNKELSWLDSVSHEGSLVCIDDYLGRWESRDLFYAEREEYVGVEGTTQRVETEKHGVKAAVDEFVGSHTWWQLQHFGGEPVVLTRRDM